LEMRIQIGYKMNTEFEDKNIREQINVKIVSNSPHI